MIGRSAIYLPIIDRVRDENIDIYGVHLNDRNEASRVQEATSLLDMIGNDNDKVIVGGDFNATYRKDALGRILRVAIPLFRSVPVIDYKPGHKPPKLHHLADMTRRASQMAIGTTLELFEAANFEDADPDHRPTAGPFNIDHLLGRNVKFFDHEVLPKTPYSDHHAISATLL
jgi:endonuclease/exonuclease/phosphatase family metal-dependent hydrolase